MLQHFVSHLPPQAPTGTNCKLGSVPLCPRQILEMQIQRAAEEMKAYVSPDPQEKKKAMRWACWARPASCLRDEWPFLFQQALVTLKPVNLLPLFPCCCDDTPLFLIHGVKSAWEMAVAHMLLIFLLFTVGKCTWRIFPNRSYLARWEKCAERVLTQRILGRVNTWKYSFILSRTWSEDTQVSQGGFTEFALEVKYRNA